MRIPCPFRYPFRLFLFILLVVLAPSARGQYFGKNKVLYENFPFRVAQSEHFDLYHYLENGEARDRLARAAEAWYGLHLSVLKDSFTRRNPLIVYKNHAQFQQTRVIAGGIDVGTGGVTEALKNRVVFPFLESNAQTDHVLGHELVHAFQYHLIKDSLKLNALNNLPLWMVEGMAEYMSTGYDDAATALWLRSALAHRQLPALRDLSLRPDVYFPYRWGQAFWAYVTGVYGDSVVQRLFIETGRKGYATAIRNLFKIDEKEFSRRWQQSIRQCFMDDRDNTDLLASGKELVSPAKSGRYNLVPSISPDGKLVAFWTEKNLFSLDLYLADAATGKLVRRITSNSIHARIDQYSAYESSIAWSPDSKTIAFVVYAKGKNELVLCGIDGSVSNVMEIPGLTDFSNPAWSPDGRSIVVTGIVEGQPDLFLYTLETSGLTQLTHDVYSEIQPSWSGDGKRLVFSTDALAMEGQKSLRRFTHNLALLDMASGEKTNLIFFSGANNFNPLFSADGKQVYFLSDGDGFRNLYLYDLGTQATDRLTHFFSGISGITAFAPAISLSRETGNLVYNYFENGTYSIFLQNISAFEKEKMERMPQHATASILPPLKRKDGEKIPVYAANNPDSIPHPVKEIPYQSRFSLDYVGNTGVGIQSGVYGIGLAGGVNTIFSDMLGNHQLFGALSLNGEIVDIAGQFAYFNQKKRMNWGVSISHIPYLSGAQYLFRDTILSSSGDSLPVLNYALDLLRTFEDQVSVFASYPFSVTKRIEAGASFAHYYYRLDRYTEYYDEKGSKYLGSARQKQPVPGGFNLAQAYLAFVSDNSFFGVASPLKGHRLRLEATRYVGRINMSTLLADYRRYIRVAPLTLALRSMYMGRHGNDDRTGLLPPLFLGYASLVRGYDALNYVNTAGSTRPTINDLIGKRIFVSNIEWRFPLSGPQRLSAFKSRFLFTELNLFSDGGIAWGRSEVFGGPPTGMVKRNARFILSTGLSLRLNLFGYLVVEPYYAIPWQNGGWTGRNFGINILPGW